MGSNARRATVVGAAGFIGRHLVRHLREQGREVLIAARDDDAWMQRPHGAVYWCAGLTADYAARPHDTVQAHVARLSRLLAQGRFDSLLYLSSTRLYDGCTRTVADEDTPLALDPREPRHLYDLSKALGESLCRHSAGGRARTARLSCVWHDHPTAGGFLPQLLRDTRLAQAQPGQPPRLRVDTSVHFARDYVHLDDVLPAMVAIAERGTQPLYNLACGRNTTNRELFARLRELTGLEVIATRHDLPAPAPRIDISRAQREFGWQPQPLSERLAALLPAPAEA